MSMRGQFFRKCCKFALSYGKARECPFCGWTGFQFAPRLDARKPSADAFCPKCNSAERHRLTYIALRDRVKHAGSVLHFAPEPPIAEWLKGISTTYLSCDLSSGAMEIQDITQLTYADSTFDLIMCSNVLEHVPDDHAAFAELYRVLKRDGTCVLAVPLWRTGASYENFTITSPEERREHFGQADHVRLYGFRDFQNRNANAGFKIEVITSRDFDPRDVGRYGMHHFTTSELFLCRK